MPVTRSTQHDTQHQAENIISADAVNPINTPVPDDDNTSLTPPGSEAEDTQGQHESPAQSTTSATEVPSGNVVISNDLLQQLLQRLAQPTITSPPRSTTTPTHTSTKGPNIRAPDTFHGTDTTKLKPFLSQCRLAFKADPHRYATEESKLMYAGSYLDSVAKKWFEPFLFLEPGMKDYPAYLDTFASFETELIKLFGGPDEEATAEYHLSKLRMRDNHQVSRYITDFRRYQTLLDWDDKALAYQFRKGLPPRILDELACRDDKPTSLANLQQVALKIDLRYWERQREKADFSHPAADKPVKPVVNQVTTKTTFIGSSTPKTNNNSTLTREGHIKPDEYRRRKENNLCLYCGEAGHPRDKCPKSKPREDKPKVELRASNKSSYSQQGKE